MASSVIKPLIEKWPSAPPVDVMFSAVAGEPFAALLDSGMDPGRLGKFSFLVTDPFATVVTRGHETIVTEQGNSKTYSEDPFGVLREIFSRWKIETPAELPPFLGGAVGYFSYDLGRFVERIPSVAVDDMGFPEMVFGLYDVGVAVNRSSSETWLFSTGFPRTDEKARKTRARERMLWLKEKLAGSQNKKSEPCLQIQPRDFFSNFSRDEYMQALVRTREYIAAGDIFQANISQRLSAPFKGSAWALYQRLRAVNPAPFAAYMNYPWLRVLSSSPERFLRVSGSKVETRPIKGTRPRGSTPEQDRLLALELMSSPKDRAELVMIVDLERNDIGRVCRYGTVRVPELTVIEAYPTVFHLVATVTGELHPDKDHLSLIRACFPGGSITGAPKVRAMEIIEELEPTRRSVYTGAIGYLGFNGETDLNIVIRTALVGNDRIYIQVGGGIVADSIPEREYQETLDKGYALLSALAGRKIDSRELTEIPKSGAPLVSRAPEIDAGQPSSADKEKGGTGF